ncbi:hypothetical protein QE357_005140 [Siphonobacter sp. BAB-5404]|nr:hypothetical protein [Siphonobacter sp. SORGH_AS_1065]MDR6198028.1 hypothetical protein [Siphonobacter sp. SORGH_AS_0500]
MIDAVIATSFLTNKVYLGNACYNVINQTRLIL